MVVQGLDLNKARTTGRIVYIDGLSELYSGKLRRDSSSKAVEGSNIVISDSRLSVIEALVSGALATAAAGSSLKPLLILDGLDFLLASTRITATELLSSLMTWRPVCLSFLSGDGESGLMFIRQHMRL